MLALPLARAESETPEVQPQSVPPAPAAPVLPLTDALVVTLRTVPTLERQGEELVGELREPRLTIQRRGTGQSEEVSVGARIRPLDTLTTDEETTAQIQLMDGSLLVLGPNARLTLTERVLTTRGVRTALTLYHGMLRAKISPVAHAGGFVLRTQAMQLQTTQVSSFVVRHREAQQVGKHGCTIVTLIDGRIETLGALSGSAAIVLDKPGQQAHYCDLTHTDPVPEVMPTEALNDLLGEIPLFTGDEPHPGDDLPLPAPVIPDTPAVGATPGFPGLPGVIVAPPRIIGDTPFEFTPSVPEGLTPVFDISP
ncbi:MAG: hypothetical protein AMXMBFR7_24850 [Planctomycetota bacterium]